MANDVRLLVDMVLDESEKRAPEIESDVRMFCPKCGSGYTQVIEKSDEIMALNDLKGRIEAFRNNTSFFRNDIRPILFKL